MIAMVVGKYDGTEYIKAGEIALSINATDGATMAKIQADHVWMGTGVNSKPIDVVIDGKLTTSELASQIAILSSVRMNTVNITTVIDSPKYTGTEALIDSIKCDYLSLSGSTSFDDCIVDASVSNNVLTLTYASGGTVTFSKATTQSGSWSSGVFTATAYQNGVAVGTPLITSITGGAGTWNDKTVTIPIYATIGSSGAVYDTGKTVTATYPGSDYATGWNACRDAMIASQYYSSYYEGTQAIKYDAPQYGAAARDVLYPYSNVTITRYFVPDPM